MNGDRLSHAGGTGHERSAEQCFTGAPGVDRAVIYGSWASRYHGEPGALPQDVDLLIIGTGDVRRIRAEADIATRELGRDVNVTVLTPTEWDAANSGFLAHVKDGPLVELSLTR